VLLSAAGTLTGTLASRNTALARQIRPRSVTPPKPSPVAGPQQQDGDDKQSDSSKAQNDAQERSQERLGHGAVDQGAQDREETAGTLRHEIYGQNDDEQQLRQAAKRLTR
jgi:hypothetical protein